MFLSTAALAQGRGASNLPPAPGNPIASLQQQINDLQQQLANLGGGEMTVRGTVAGNTFQAPNGALQGSGFTAINSGPGRYTVNFATPFGAPPTITLALEMLTMTAGIPQVIILDTGAGQVTNCGFHVYISGAAQFTTTNPASGAQELRWTPGSENWHFIAIGPQALPRTPCQ
jgi:hypothetical protein